MSSETDNKKYLIFRVPGDSSLGLDHLLAELKGTIREAVHLDRTLIIDKYRMGAIHNLGHYLKNLDIRRYINLDKTQIYKVEEGKNIRQISNSLRYITAEDFNINNYPEEQVLLTKGDIEPITEEQNNQYKVIIRETDHYRYPEFYSDIIVSFYPSDEVDHLTDTVLRTMNTSLSEVKKRELIYRGVDFSANRDIFQQTMPDNPLYYAAVHIRTRISEGICYDRALKYWTSPHHLKYIISRAVPKGSRIYILSDLYNPNYFDYLKKDYIVCRYHDFPELHSLVSGNDAQQINNAMLYSVEKNILQHAHVKIILSQKDSKLLYLNSHFMIPWPYRFIQFLEYIKNHLFKIIRHPGLVRNIPQDLNNIFIGKPPYY